MENTPTQVQSRLAFFPISFFSMVMGLCGLTIAWEKAQLLLGIELGINLLLQLFSTSVFSLLLLIYTSKFIFYREKITQELNHPIKLSFFPTISISLLLLAIVFLPFNPSVSLPLWMMGASLHLLLLLFILNRWMHREHFQIQHINPAWFIPAVGNVLVPIAGIPLGYTDISWFFFSIGMLFWLILLTIIFYRILFHSPIDERLLPTLFILIAPPAVGFTAYMKLTGGVLDGFGHFLYFAGLFLTLLLFSQVNRFVRLPFALSWWAYSFPTAAITLATYIMYEKTTKPFYFVLGNILLVILTAIVGLLLVRTVLAITKGKVCLPD